MAFNATPPSVTTLWAAKVPPEPHLGNTEWACLAAAFGHLSPTFQRVLLPLRGCHRHAGLGHSASHPIVRQLGTEEQRSLFFSPHHFTHFAGMSPEESRPLFEMLVDMVTRNRTTYRHRWSPGDLVAWDGRQTLHFGHTDFDRRHRRSLHRTTALYEASVAASNTNDAPCYSMNETEELGAAFPAV